MQKDAIVSLLAIAVEVFMTAYNSLKNTMQVTNPASLTLSPWFTNPSRNARCSL